MSDMFHIREHVVSGQHIREYARATAHKQEEALQLAVKQYVPKDNPDPQPGDITILASHANGFVKELYEPLWEDLVHACRRQGVRVRAIWIADTAWQGQSGILNEHSLGSEPSWFDHSRDLLHLTNVFRAEMPRPLFGLGHSFGGSVLVHLAYMHPRLFSGLIMVDPVMSRRFRHGPLYGFQTMRASAGRRDLWPSRADAERAIRKNKFYSMWDPRALDRMIKYGFRDCPTLVYPDKTEPAVTLTTSKHMECLTYYRPTHQGPIDTATGKRTMDRSLILDATSDVDEFPKFPFYQPPTAVIASRIGELRPAVLWLAGENSTVCTPETQEEKMELTGYGYGGSGGAKAGRVKEHIVKGVGHLVALERPTEVADRAAVFIQDEVDRWRKEEEAYEREWVQGVAARDKTVMSQEFRDLIDSVGPEANERRDGTVAGPTSKL
ncbi:Alpha/beta hydrolase family-domain-containing protein [Coniella lustricola]|uniref:Alpha/beta hydrolase family-domain-containing protein n=1 Tax=Coniella lustricola TaxID=2025994 RepID=A0A2T2ZWV1_9PEZI|nr:Alpha/beta hydrolase family-domain-containing protein [Coniella lustricola]